MRKCNVSQVSSGIGNLVSLRHLSLSVNTFSSLPESFSNLSKLERLYINDCSQLQLLPPLPSQLTYIEATNCGSLDVMPFDSMQNAYIFRSKAFKESLTSTEGLEVPLSGKEVPEWCTYRNSGHVISFVTPVQFHSKICALILCATRDKDKHFGQWVYPTIYNKTKGTRRRLSIVGFNIASRIVMFYPLDDTTLVVEAGDTMELLFNDQESVKSVGLRLICEDDVVDSGLILKDVRKPTLSC
nr:hypothetical protein [Tanacetum cinerariifolium]